MLLTTDSYKKIIQPQLFLASQNKITKGLLKTDLPKLERFFNNTWKIQFRIYRYLDGELNDMYEKVTGMKLIEAQSLCWFKITKCTENNDEDGLEYKDVEALSLEDELIGKKVYDINGTFALYNIADTSKSLLHIIVQSCPSWSIGHVDNSLLGKYRTFSIDSKQVYGLLMDDISSSFECIFQFDTYNRTISAYDFTKYGKQTDIIFSHERLIQASSIECNYDEIKTVLRVVGGDELDIRAVNPTGSNTIMNIDYYKTTEYMSQGLIDALNNYQTAYTANQTYYTNQLTLLKTKQEDLQQLNTKVPGENDSVTNWTKYGLNGLNSQKKTRETQQGVYVANGDSNPSSLVYQQYLVVWNELQAINSEIRVRENQIVAKEKEIDNVFSALKAVNNSLDQKNYLTTDQIKELDCFLYTDDFIDDTYVVTDNDSDEEAILVKQELYDAASKELVRCSQPQYTVSVTSANIFNLADYVTSGALDSLELGDFVTIIFRDDYYSYARLLSMTIDFADTSKIDLKFSNKSSLDDGMLQFGEVLAEAKGNNTTLSLKGIGYDKARNQVDDVQEFMTSALNATTNELINGKNKEMSFGEYGLRGREWLSEQNRYDKREMWINNNILLFSDDNFKTSKTGIGKFADDSGNEFYGFMGEAIVSPIVLSNHVHVTNPNGTFDIGTNGFTGYNSSNSFTFDLTNAAKMFSLKLGNTDLMTVGSNGLTINGNGTFKGTVTASIINGSEIYGTSISGSSITGSSFQALTGNYNMLLSSSGLTFTNTGDTGDQLIINSLNIGWKRSDGALSTTLLPGIVSTPELQVQAIKIVGTSSFVISNPANASVKINTYDILTSGNYGTYCAAPNHTHTQYASSTHYHGTLYSSSSSSGKTAYISDNANFVCPNSGDLGTSSNPWLNVRANNVYNSGGLITSSDERKKNTIEPLNDKYILLFDKLNPVSYKYNEGTSGRTHLGLIAQEVEQAMQDVGLTDKECAILVKDPVYEKMNDDGSYDETSEVVDYDYSIRYSELVPLCIQMIRELQGEITELKR